MELNSVFAEYFYPCTPDESKVNTEICKKCGGKCCNTMGCHISPFNLKEVSVESIISLIDESGCISIDWWGGNPITNEDTNEKVFYLRIKNKGGKIVDPSFGGQCAILTDIGCPLSFEYRPKGARDLIPSEGQCHVGYTKQQCAIDWYPYLDIMKEVYMHYLRKGDVSNSSFTVFSIYEDMLGMIFGK